MNVCEFCLLQAKDGTCKLDFDIPKGMSCREFTPGIDKFCSDPKDFAGQNQIVEMATFFGFRKMELKKIKIMAAGEESVRL